MVHAEWMHKQLDCCNTPVTTMAATAPKNNLFEAAIIYDLFVWTHTHTGKPTRQLQINSFEMIFPMQAIELFKTINPNNNKVIRRKVNSSLFLTFHTNWFNWISAVVGLGAVVCKRRAHCISTLSLCNRWTFRQIRSKAKRYQIKWIKRR